MLDTPRYSRRNVIKTSGVAISTLSIAGCLTSATSSGGNDDTPSDTGSNEPDVTVEVGPEEELIFQPEELNIRQGDTVEWVWKSDTHNVVVEDQPTSAEWNGSPGSESDIYDTGYSFVHTFDTPGTYTYYCQPHQAVGMTGEIRVTESTEGTEM